MVRKLGVLAMACAGVLLAGCMTPVGPSGSYASEKNRLLLALGTPTHQCGQHWDSMAGALQVKLTQEMQVQIQQSPISQTGAPPARVPWANRLTGTQEKAVRDSLLRLYRTLSYAAEMGQYDMQPGPITGPPVALTPSQLEIAILALELEDIFEADRFSGHHPNCNQARWKGPTPPDLGPLLRAIRDALDM